MHTHTYIPTHMIHNIIHTHTTYIHTYTHTHTHARTHTHRPERGLVDVSREVREWYMFLSSRRLGEVMVMQRWQSRRNGLRAFSRHVGSYQTR